MFELALLSGSQTMIWVVFLGACAVAACFTFVFKAFRK
jgi:hypothetical protein